jgi:hypothetical protein
MTWGSVLLYPPPNSSIMVVNGPATPIKSHQEAQALLNPEPEILPSRRLRGRVVGTYAVPFGNRDSGFVTTAMDALALTLEGIPGDRQCGLTRRAGGREPWYFSGRGNAQ